MITIHTKPDLYNLGGKWFLTTRQQLTVDFGAGEVDIIPKYQITDGASIPSWLRWLIPWWSILVSALWHDDKRENSLKDTFAIDADFKALCQYELKSNGYPPKWAWLLAASAFIGVRIGYYINFKSTPPQHVVEMAIQEIKTREGEKWYEENRHTFNFSSYSVFVHSL